MESFITCLDNIRQKLLIMNSSSGNGWNGASFWYDSNHAMKSVCGVRLTGGELIFSNALFIYFNYIFWI